ncbi:MAG: MFS transporter [Alphaproteobacteria bacterium]|nr:MFS transporter [Alphaproteobacteria bacterium]MCB9946209.1 MFS transporter [Rhodospirillaceae bacterium]
MAPLVVHIVRDLEISHAQMGVVLGGWQLVYIATAAPCGTVIDRWGPRVGLLLSAGFIATSAVLRAHAVDFWTLLLAVGVFGIGGPMVSIGAPKLISLWFRGPERGFAMGVYVTGPATGGIVSYSLTNSVLMPWFGQDWRSVLLLLSAVALGCGLLWLALSAHPRARAIERELKAQPKERQLTVFARLLALPSVQVMLVMSVGIFFFNHGLNNWLPELLRQGGMSPAEAGIWAALPTAVGILGALTIPRLAVPERRLAILAALFAAAGLAALLLLTGEGAAMTVGLIAQGIARSSMMTVMVLLLVEIREIGSRYAGAASGLFFSAAEVGGVLGPLTLGAVYDATGAFQPALLLLAAIMAGLVLLLLPLRRRLA